MKDFLLNFLVFLHFESNFSNISKMHPFAFMLKNFILELFMKKVLNQKKAVMTVKISYRILLFISVY